MDAATGVHNPAISVTPASTATISTIVDASGGLSQSTVTPRTTSAAPATSLIKSRPTPGKPVAKVEKRRRRYLPVTGSASVGCEPSLKRVSYGLNPVSGIDDPPFNADHGGVGSIIGAQFGKDVLDPSLDRFFGD